MTESAPQSAPQSFLDAGTAAVIAFSLSALVLLGNSLMMQGAYSLFGLWSSTPYSRATFLAVWILGAMLPAIAALWLGRRAHTDPAAVAWQQTMGKAAFLLAIVAVGYTVIMIVGSLIHDYF